MINHLDAVIRKIEHEWTSKTILVIGDLMVDKYIWGKVARISPEAPVPIVLAERETSQPGGAANVAMNLANLGSRVRVLGFTGEDQNEALLEQRLRSNGIEPLFIHCDGYPTVTKARILAGGQQILRLDTERIGRRSESGYELLISLACKHLKNCDAVVLSDYAKGVFTRESCQSIIQTARHLGIPVFVDPKSTDFSWYRGATTICPNLSELSRALGAESKELDEVLAESAMLVSSLELDFLTATLSEKGIALVRQDRRFIAPAEARQVFDVSGAGDAVLAVLTLCIASGLEPEIAIQVANLAGGIVVGKAGTVPIERHELLAALSPEIILQTQEKVVDLDELMIRVATWRRQGEKVVFTNGCFDLLHVGHITLLEQARRFGDRLVVAINSDGSVRGLKGPKRPIVSHPDRARVLAALGVVDAVVVFADGTPIELINAIRPDILVKGGDYSPETVVGAQEIETWGGQVRIVPTVEGFSTTRLINEHNQVKAQ